MKTILTLTVATLFAGFLATQKGHDVEPIESKGVVFVFTTHTCPVANVGANCVKDVVAWSPAFATMRACDDHATIVLSKIKDAHRMAQCERQKES